MPSVVDRDANERTHLDSYEWSWPDHPQEMSHGEARMRIQREEPAVGPHTEHDRLDEDALAVEYGKLLEEGRAGIQQRTHTGDDLPRHVDGSLLGIKQQLAADVTEMRNGWMPEVYDTNRAVAKDPGPALERRWGATNENAMSAWLPQTGNPHDGDNAVVAARAVAGATDSEAAKHIAWCANRELNDDGATWREAVVRGRQIEGDPDDLRKCAERMPRELEIVVDDQRGDYKTEAYGPNWIVLHVPRPQGDEVQKARAELYAVARGTLATEYGPPLGDDEKAFDALAASITANRGTCGAGLGWDPPEPDLLREAGRELQRRPERLQELADRIATVERKLYPPWPERGIERGPEDAPERDRDVREPPPPARGPAPNRNLPRERDHDRGGPSR